MGWIEPDRNYDGIQFEALRRETEKPFTDFDDALSSAYYSAKRNGQGGKILDHPGLSKNGERWIIDFEAEISKSPEGAKSIFDSLCALWQWNLAKTFHEANMELAEENRIPESKYNYAVDDIGTTVYEDAVSRINISKSEGVELVVG